MGVDSTMLEPKFNQRGSILLVGGSDGIKTTIKTFKESLQFKFEYKNDRKSKLIYKN